MDLASLGKTAAKLGIGRVFPPTGRGLSEALITACGRTERVLGCGFGDALTTNLAGRYDEVDQLASLLVISVLVGRVDELAHACVETNPEDFDVTVIGVDPITFLGVLAEELHNEIRSRAKTAGSPLTGWFTVLQGEATLGELGGLRRAQAEIAERLGEMPARATPGGVYHRPGMGRAAGLNVDGIAPTYHAFISYVREDGAEVDRIQEALHTAGVRVWRDTEDLWPGEDWRLKIKQAITSDSLVFVACFSDRSASRTTSYQNEELLLAIDQFRRRHPDPPWLIPVRLSDCALPQFDLGAGRTLDSLQRVDVFGDRSERGMERLVTGVLRVVSSLEAIYHEEPLPTSPSQPPTEPRPHIGMEKFYEEQALTRPDPEPLAHEAAKVEGRIERLSGIHARGAELRKQPSVSEPEVEAWLSEALDPLVKGERWTVLHAPPVHSPAEEPDDIKRRLEDLVQGLWDVITHESIRLHGLKGPTS